MAGRAFLALIALVFIIGVFDIPIWPKAKWGFIDRAGNVVIAPQFERVNGIGEGNLCYTYRTQKSFHEGLAAVAVGNLWGFIDKTGKIVVNPQFEAVGDFSEGLACVQSEKKCGFINRAGDLVIPPKFHPHALYCGFMHFNDGLCPAELEPWLMGYIDKKGNWVVKPTLSFAWPFSEGRAVIGGKGANSNALLDMSGKIAVEPKDCQFEASFSDGLARVRGLTADKDGVERHWFVDRCGRKATKVLVGKVHDFSEGLAAANLGTDKFGYVDHEGETVIKMLFGQANEFHEGLAAVGIHDPKETSKHRYKWGYIDKTGAWVIAPQYDEAGEFSQGRAAVGIENRQAVIDKTGKTIVGPKYTHIFPFSEGLAATQ